MTCSVTLVGGICVLGAYIFYLLAVALSFNPLRSLPGPPVRGYFGNHLNLVLKYDGLASTRPALTACPVTALRYPPERMNCSPANTVER